MLIVVGKHLVSPPGLRSSTHWLNSVKAIAVNANHNEKLLSKNLPKKSRSLSFMCVCQNIQYFSIVRLRWNSFMFPLELSFWIYGCTGTPQARGKKRGGNDANLYHEKFSGYPIIPILRQNYYHMSIQIIIY